MAENRLVPRYEFSDNIDHITAPRFSSGEYLGHYSCEIVKFLSTGDSNPGFVVRFEDGHEAGAYRRELRATEVGWNTINNMQNEG